MRQISLVIGLLIFLAACSKPETETIPIENEASNILEIENGWVRPGNAGMMTAAYFTISNGTSENDSLLSIYTDIAADTQIHESYDTGEGTMGMRPIGLVPVLANSTTELKPGGIHIMVIRPYNDVTEGDSVDFVLQFVNNGEFKIKLPIQSSLY